MFRSTRRQYQQHIESLKATVRKYEAMARECAAKETRTQAVLDEVAHQRDRQAAELAQIKVALDEVAVYQGMIDVSPVALLVSELVRDHEELEARIDAVIMLLKGAKEEANVTDEPSPLIDEVARLLQGGERFFPEALSADD
jgi:C4-dicarboxylate-specific signal transduction histidine kinase